MEPGDWFAINEEPVPLVPHPPDGKSEFSCSKVGYPHLFPGGFFIFFSFM